MKQYKTFLKKKQKNIFGDYFWKTNEKICQKNILQKYFNHKFEKKLRKKLRKNERYVRKMILGNLFEK